MSDPTLIDRIYEAERQSLAESPPRRPSATYRLQLHKGFRLADARAIVPYLHALGVSDAYLSPYLEARPGSTHGYDVFDHGRINPEIGDDDEHARFVATLADHGMGRLLDVVPNHMGIGGPNRFWLDVLEVGALSPYSNFFDIDWNPVKDELEGRILLPILGDQYGKVLESGELKIERQGGRFVLKYYETTLPLSPKSYALILSEASRELSRSFDQECPEVLELVSIWGSARGLPDRDTREPDHITQWLREQKIIPRRIARLCEESPRLCGLIDRVLERFRGEPGKPETFDLLHRLLEEQVYRLSSWRVAAQEINYRRFFDINDLAGLRTEDPRVFEAIHALIFQWIAEGGVTGLRIDHPDGLADPLGYFRRLQESVFLIRCRARFEAEGGEPNDWFAASHALRKRFREEANDRQSPLARPFPIVAEKILSRGEDLPQDWPIDGTVGYEYLNSLNGLFIEGANAEAITSIYEEFTGDREPFPEVLYHSKLLICQASLASEINALARQLNRVSEHDRKSRDFTLNDLRLAIRQTIALFPVYRTYIQPGEPASERDRGIVEQAVARARKRTPALDPSIFDFLRTSLLLEPVEGMSADGQALREVFVRRFQQTTGPIQAKGLEDTAFYRQVPLVSKNEVGADPSRFGNSPGVFHAMNANRVSDWPGTLSTTATHDTKRGEDARLRIDVLSEIPEEWRAHLARWSRWNSRWKADVNGSTAPDAREEYLFYQALIGSWPFGADAEPPSEEFVGRMRQYMLKAVKEAKLNTSWNDPDPSYADAIGNFVEQALTGSDVEPFLRDFAPFAARVARVGVVHSLAQALLKIASPGVPDVYQGCELWDLSLVDPDNRRPVDYEARRKSLEAIDGALNRGQSRADRARDLLARAEDGAIKQYVVATALRQRRDDPALYFQGAYRPLEADGEHRGRIIAFGRYREGRSVIVAAPRLVSSLMGEDGARMPLGDLWGDTRLVLPEGPIPRRWRDLLTDRVLEIREVDGPPDLPMAEVFAILPVALLVGE